MRVERVGKEGGFLLSCMSHRRAKLGQSPVLRPGLTPGTASDLLGGVTKERRTAPNETSK